jgi:hypothetical protein
MANSFSPTITATIGNLIVLSYFLIHILMAVFAQKEAPAPVKNK